GIINVRGDIRIGGHVIDGPHGIPAYSYPPNFSEMGIDTADPAARPPVSDPANNFLAFPHVVTHESLPRGGVGHEEPANGVALMEPFLTTTFDGPQFDDILGLQRLYGDRLEKNGGNDTLATATPLGAVPTGGSVVIGKDANTTTQTVLPSQSDFVSIDDDFDTDVYSFTVAPGGAFSLTPQ